MKAAAANFLGRSAPPPGAGAAGGGDNFDDGHWPKPDERTIVRDIEKARRHSGDTTADYIRALLKEKAQRFYQHLLHAYDDVHRTLAERLRPGGLTVSAIERTTLEAEEAMEGVVDEHFIDVVSTHERAEESEHDYNRFRKANAISRLPHYPPSKLNHVLLVLIIAALETIFAAYLLGGVTSDGYVGAWTLAITLSVVNVGGAMFAGVFARFVNHRSALWKAVGMIPAAAIAFVLLFFNLYAGHLRQAIQTGTVEAAAAGQLAWTTFTANYFAIKDDSWIFVFVGLMVAGLAAWKGYSMEDAYPGYGRRHRTMLSDQDDRDGRLRNAFDNLRARADDGAKRIHGEVELFETGRQADQRIREEHASLHDDLIQAALSGHATFERLRELYCKDAEPLAVMEPPLEKQLPDVFTAEDPADVKKAAATALERLAAFHQRLREVFEKRERRS